MEAAEAAAAFHAAQARQREELKRKQELEKEQAKEVVIGRCCLNRGLGADICSCCKDPVKALVLQQQQRVQLRCTAGCGFKHVMVVHYPDCWRRFQDGWRAEGDNLHEALRTKGHSKLVTCITPGCDGYLSQVTLLDGEAGHRNVLYELSKEQQEVARQKGVETKAAAAEARQAALAAAKQQQDEANLAKWRERTGWKPKKPKQPRAKKPPKQQQPAAAGDPAVRDQLAELLGPAGGGKGPGAAAAAPAPAPAKKGIQVRVRAIVTKEEVPEVALPDEWQSQAGGWGGLVGCVVGCCCVTSYGL